MLWRARNLGWKNRVFRLASYGVEGKEYHLDSIAVSGAYLEPGVSFYPDFTRTDVPICPYLQS